MATVLPPHLRPRHMATILDILGERPFNNRSLDRAAADPTTNECVRFPWFPFGGANRLSCNRFVNLKCVFLFPRVLRENYALCSFGRGHIFLAVWDGTSLLPVLSGKVSELPHRRHIIFCHLLTNYVPSGCSVWRRERQTDAGIGIHGTA